MAERGARHLNVVQNEVFILDRQEDLYGTFSQDINPIEDVAMLEDDLTFLAIFFAQLIHYQLERVRSQLLETAEVEQQVFEPLLVFVLILDQVFI